MCGLCLLSESFGDIHSCSACSGFVRTKIITQRMEKKEKKKDACAYIQEGFLFLLHSEGSELREVSQGNLSILETASELCSRLSLCTQW